MSSGLSIHNLPVRIGPYKLGRTLGIGSFGKVKHAIHEITGIEVAVKILNRKKIKNLEMKEKVCINYYLS